METINAKTDRPSRQRLYILLHRYSTATLLVLRSEDLNKRIGDAVTDERRKLKAAHDTEKREIIERENRDILEKHLVRSSRDATFERLPTIVLRDSSRFRARFRKMDEKTIDVIILRNGDRINGKIYNQIVPVMKESLT